MITVVSPHIQYTEWDTSPSQGQIQKLYIVDMPQPFPNLIENIMHMNRISVIIYNITQQCTQILMVYIYLIRILQHILNGYTGTFFVLVGV